MAIRSIAVVPRTADALLLDTSCIIRLSHEGAAGVDRRTLALLESEDVTRYVSSLSIQEIAQKVNRGRLAMSEHDIDRVLFDLSAEVLPYTERHARRLYGLPLHHADPIDRMLICTSLVENLPVVTSDEVFRLYKGVRVLPL